MAFYPEGIITALLTPLRDDESLDETALVARVREQVAAGVHGIMVGGVSGEYVNLTPDERERLVREATAVVRGACPVVAGILEPHTRAAIHAAVRAEEAGADALLVLTPFHNLPTMPGVVAHFRAVHDATRLPIILYNNPGRTGIDLDHGAFAELAALSRIVGVKECRRDLGVVSEQIRRAPPGFAVLSGEDDLAFLTFLLGGRGAILTSANVIPHVWMDLWRCAQRGEVPKGIELHHRMMPLINAVYTRNHPYPIKRAMALAGRPVGPARPPLLPPDPAQESAIRAALVELGLATPA